MTFGELLRKLLLLTQLKAGHLAAALGYDVSYISRWVNDIKLPSLKNNGELFHNIAHFLVVNSSEAEHRRLVQEFSLPEDALEDLLLKTYSAQRDTTALHAAPNRTGPNSIVTKSLDQEKTWEWIAEAVASVCGRPDTDVLEFFTPSPMQYFSANTIDFFPRIRKFESVRKPIHVRQFIHFENLNAHLDAYCRTICTFLSYDTEDVCYDFYEITDKAGLRSASLVLKNGLYLQGIDAPFSGMSYQMVTRDPEIIDDLYGSMERYIRGRRCMTERHTSAELYANKYYMNYLMTSAFRYILTVMHPIGMDSGLLQTLGTHYLSDGAFRDWALAFTEKTFSLPRSVVIYKSAMMSYLYDGVILLFGRTLTLTKEERVQHLRSLIDALRDDPDLKLTIIDDLNPIMCRKELSISLYLSNGAVFASKHQENGKPEPLTHVFTSIRLIDAMNTFFEHLETMPGEYAIRDGKVIDFLTHGIELI